MTRPPNIRLLLGRGIMAKSTIFCVLFTGLLCSFTTGQLLQQNQEIICNFASCMGWCECLGDTIDLSKFTEHFAFSSCSLGDTFLGFGTCRDDESKVVIAQRRDRGNVKACQNLRTNPLIFFKNDTIGNGTYALQAWDASAKENAVLLREFCAPQCNPRCGIFPPTTPTPPFPMTTSMSTRRIDEVIPRFSPAPTSESGLSPAEVRILGIAIGAFLAGLLILLIVIFICYRRRKENKNRGPRLPPRRNMPTRENRDYATIEEIQMTTTNGSPARRGGAYPNGVYRSESLSAINALNPDPSLHRSLSDIALLGDPPHPPMRQVSLLPGVNPALADVTDARSAPQDADGYTKYLPDEPPHRLPYMHLKVSSSLSDSGTQKQSPPKPHRYRSNTHANGEDVDRVIEKIRARQAMKDLNNRRFVPNQSGKGRSSTLSDDYNRLNRGGGHKGVPRSRKQDFGAFTPVPVHGQYQSKPRRSPESVRRWRSLPDMTDGGQVSSTLQADSGDENPPVYHLLERSPASSIGDYSKRKTCQLPTGHTTEKGQSQQKSRNSRDSRRAASESAPSTYRAPTESNTIDERYDPVYDSHVPNGTDIADGPQTPGDYQPLSTYRPEYLEFDEHPVTEPALDRYAYLKPNGAPPTFRENGRLSGGSSGIKSPTIIQNGDPSRDKSYIYESDNNNLSVKTQPSRTVGGSTYVPLRLRQTEDDYDNTDMMDDDMENGEYMYHPAGPDVTI